MLPLSSRPWSVPAPSTSSVTADTTVVARVQLPRGAESPTLTHQLDIGRIFAERTTIQRTVHVTLKQEKRMVTADGEEGDWMPHVHWAKDCHVQNLQVVFSEGSLFFRTIRTINEGEQLYIWFTEDIAKELGIPFLSPCNIQGQERYVCHVCAHIFTDPNPLKIHLAFLCRTMEPQGEAPWFHSQTQASVNRLLLPPMQPSTMLLPWRPLTVYPTPTNSVLGDSLCSRFSPWASHASFGFSRATLPSLLPNSTSVSFANPPLVSTVGKIRRGHQCAYCGKLYSRKYGLKIHIRTHTGYKPLKCRVCLRPFGDPSNLNKHVRLHALGHTPYRCETCGKVLVRRRDLERHIKSRHSDQPEPGPSQ